MNLVRYISIRYFSHKLGKAVLPYRNSMSNIVKLGKEDLEFSSESAANSLLSGHIIALPTDTIYGIAALAQNNKAIEHIYEVKQRNSSKPLAICVSKIDDVYKWGKVTVPYSLLCALLPGPVTLVFQRTDELNKNLNPDTDLVGIRIPNDEFILKVSEKCDSPLALTSANISQGVSPLNIKEFMILWSELHKVYDGGQLGSKPACRLGSTIVDLSVKGYYKVIRRGSAFHRTVSVLHDHNIKLVD